MSSERYNRQSFLGHQSEEILARLRVAVIGLGGGGSHIVQQLGHVGVKNFMIFDPDTVDKEGTNLNRLVGATVQDAKYETQKTEVAKRLIFGLQPDAECVAIRKKWQEDDRALRSCDIVFGCVDSFAERAALERFLRRFYIPYIDIGMDVHDDQTHHSITGQVARSIPNEPCLWCLGILTKEKVAEEAKKYGAVGNRPQVVWSNGVLASTAVGLMMEMVTPWHSSTRPVACVEYDGNKHTMEVSNLLGEVTDGECHHYSLDDTGDAFFKL